MEGRVRVRGRGRVRVCVELLPPCQHTKEGGAAPADEPIRLVSVRVRVRVGS